MTATTSKPKRETWKDWIPEGADEPTQVYTRPELIKELRRANIEAKDSDLRYWEQIGLLPQAVRRWHNGATRTIYPEWYLYLIRRIRQLQAAGQSLDQIRPRLRRSAEVWLGRDGDQWDGLRAQIGSPFGPYMLGAEVVTPPASATAQLSEFAETVDGMTGVRTAHIDIVYVAEDGAEVRYTIDRRRDRP